MTTKGLAMQTLVPLIALDRLRLHVLSLDVYKRQLTRLVALGPRETENIQRLENSQMHQKIDEALGALVNQLRVLGYWLRRRWS